MAPTGTVEGPSVPSAPVANITKRMAKKMRKHLADDEQAQIALLVEPKGTYGLGMFTVAAAPRSAARSLVRKAEDAHEASGGIASSFPSESSVLLVTDRRALAAPSNGLTVKAPTFDVPVTSVKVKSIQRKGLGRRIELVFSDGSGVTVDGQAGQPYKELESLLGTIS